jgi:hypothetical protein
MLGVISLHKKAISLFELTCGRNADQLSEIFFVLLVASTDAPENLEKLLS